MAVSFQATEIRTRLAILDRQDPRRRSFGAEVHQYRLHPPLPEAEIDAFEVKHRITLPADYRYFITQVGNGGAGPYYGVFKFGEHDRGDGFCAGDESDLVGDLSAQFPHRDAWNLPDSFWSRMPNPEPGISMDEEDRLMAAWDKEMAEHYWNARIMNGAVPICHLGCALRLWLVVNGPQKGFIWRDDRADHGGIHPLRDELGKPMTFADWYLAWLTNPDREMKIVPSAVAGAERTWRQRLIDWSKLALLIGGGVLGYAAYLFIRMAFGLRLPGDR